MGGRGWISHAYSRKYSRFVRLSLLGFKTPHFRNVDVKKDTQSFFAAPLPTSLSSGKKERVNVSYNIVDRRSTKGANEKARGDCLGLFVGSPVEAIFEIERIPEASSSAKVIVFVPLL